MDPVTTAAGITAAASALTTGGTAVANTKLNKKNREWQEKMSALQYQRNIDLWKLQNEYNTPSAQVARLRAAGLNPNLLYGNGSVATGNADQIQSADIPGTPNSVPYDFSQVSNGVASSLRMYQDWQLNNAALAKSKAETENIAANTLLAQATREGRLIGNTIDRITANFAEKNARIDFLAKQAGISRTESETWLNNSRRAAVQLGMYQDAAAFETKLNLLKAQVFQAKASAMNAFGSFQESQARIAADLYGSQASLNRSQASLNNQQYDFLDPFYSHGVNPNSPWTTQLMQRSDNLTPGGFIGWYSLKNQSNFLRKIFDRIVNINNRYGGSLK